MIELINFIYKQRDGASIGFSFGPNLENGTELQKKILQSLIESGDLKFYIRCVDGTLLFAKEDDIEYIHSRFNSFHKNLKFMMGCFEYNNVYFLEITIGEKETDLAVLWQYRAIL